MNLIQTLCALCDVAAVSGYETQGADAVRKLLAPYCEDIEIDAFGNVTALRRCGKANAKTVLLDAHMDQIGFVVTDVLDNGFLRFMQIGGVDPRMLLGCEVTILTASPLHGIISCMPPHLLKAGEENNAVAMEEMLIDTGLRDARGKIAIGTPIIFAEQTISLSPDSITGKCLDDRAGIVAIVRALELLQHTPLAVDLAVLISVQEETTSLGAGIGTWRIRPDVAIAVDVGHAKTPDAPSDKTFVYGGGVMIGMGPNMHTALTQMLLKTARAEEIEHQIEVMQGHSGTNAWAMQVAACGTAQAILSIPLRYMHTPIESVMCSDIESVAQLLSRFIAQFNGEVGIGC